MSTAQTHLAKYNVSIEAANSFITSNLTNPNNIFNVCKTFGVTNFMLQEITGYSESVIRAFWTSLSLNPDQLVSPGITITGDSTKNLITGTYGDDIINGNSSDDWIEPGLGNDTITSAAGGAISYYDHTSGITADLQKGTVTAMGKSDTFSNSTIYRIQGSQFDDTIIGRTDSAGPFDGYNAFEGMKGNDTFIGSVNHDELMYHQEKGGQGISVNFQTGSAVDTYGDTDTFSKIESVRATQYDDVLIGSDNTDAEAYTMFRALAGNDTIQGGAAYDIARYDKDEIYTDQDGNYGTAGITANLQEGFIIDGYGHRDTVSSIEEVRGTRFDDRMIGSNAAKEEFRGGAGNDTLTGNGGKDHFRYSLTDDEGKDTITDFTIGEDFLEFANVKNFASDINISTTGGDTIVTFGESNQITLTGVTGLSESDFIL